MGMSISQWFEGFQHHRDEGSRLRTVRGRGTSMRLFLECIGDKPLAEVTIADLRRFQTWLLRDPKRGASSANSHIRNLGRVFSEAVDEGHLADHPLKALRKLRIPKRRVEVYSRDEAGRILAACDRVRQRPGGQCWKTRFLLAICCGLRRGEVMAAKVADIDFERKEIWVRESPETRETWWFGVKDYEDRKVPLSETLERFLTQRIAELPERHPYLCLTPRRYQRCQRLRAEGLWSEDLSLEPDQNFDKPMQRIFRLAGIDRRRRSFHAFRALCITSWLADGLPPQEVQALAGHSDVTTTMRYYAAVGHDHVRRAAESSEKILQYFQKGFLELTRPKDSLLT